MNRVEWKANGELAVGKGATVQEFMANFGADKLAIDVAPWGEGTSKTRKVGGALFASYKKSPSITCRPSPLPSKNRTKLGNCLP